MPCNLEVPGDEALDGVVAQSTAAATREDMIRLLRTAVFDPGAQRASGPAVERCATLLAAFAMATHVRAGAEHAVLDAQTGQFRYAKRCPHCDEE